MTSPFNPDTADCAQPIDAAVLMDYWLGALPSAQEEPVEEHLMACDRCGARLRETIGLAESLRTLARSGALQVVLSDEFLDHARESGQRVRQYSPPRGGSVQCTVAADDDMLIARMAADLSQTARVDLSWCDGRGVEFLRMPDIPVRRDSGMVICQQAIVYAKGAASGTMIARLMGVDADGGERLLGEYTFNHTRTIPGPPLWD